MFWTRPNYFSDGVRLHLHFKDVKSTPAAIYIAGGNLRRSSPLGTALNIQAPYFSLLNYLSYIGILYLTKLSAIFTGSTLNLIRCYEELCCMFVDSVICITILFYDLLKGDDLQRNV